MHLIYAQLRDSKYQSKIQCGNRRFRTLFYKLVVRPPTYSARNAAELGKMGKHYRCLALRVRPRPPP